MSSRPAHVSARMMTLLIGDQGIHCAMGLLASYRRIAFCDARETCDARERCECFQHESMWVRLSPSPRLWSPTIWSASHSAAAALDHQQALVWLGSRFLASRLFGRISPVAAERTRQVEVVCGVLQEAVKGCGSESRRANRRHDIGRS